VNLAAFHLRAGVQRTTAAAALLCACTLACANVAPTATARALQRQSLLPADPGVPRVGEHIARAPIASSQRPPRRADDFLPIRQAYGETVDAGSRAFTPRQKAARALQQPARAGTRAARPGALCSGTDFSGLSGAALISFIDAADLTGCMYSLYSGSVDDYRTVFSNANIVTVANTLQSRAVSYAGNDSNHSMNLLSFLRSAGYWNFMSTTGDPANDIPPGDPAMMGAARSALMQIIASPHFYDQTEDNAMFVSEVYKTAPSGFALAFAPSAKQWLDTVTPATAAIGYWTDEAIVAEFSVYYSGQYQPDYVAAVQNDVSYAAGLNAFLTRNLGLVGTDTSYLLGDAIGEMIRFEEYAPLIARVRAMATAQMPNFPVSQDSTIDIWISAAGMVDTYDAANCAAYGTCNGQATVEAMKLPTVYPCAPYTIRSEAMTQAQLASTCDSVTKETKYYHKLLSATKKGPVADDRNKTLELDVFDNYDEYSRFSGYLFGNSTNNGGIYLEGDPSVKGNQARFVAYRADWLADFQIWNLNHEFAHYLDGRFDMWGGFDDYPVTVGGSGPVHDSAVWWIEGFAEYMSYTFRRVYYADATSRAQTAPLALSEVMRNTYDSGTPRVYNWGYLAVRYVIERQPNVQLQFLPMMRTGDYAGYSSYVDALGTSLDADFGAWLSQCVGGGDIQSSRCTSLGAGTKPLLTPSAIGACDLGSASALQNGCSRALAPSGVLSYYLPTSTWDQSIFTLTQVAGAADVYAKADGWPTENDYQAKGSSTGNDVSLTLPAGTSGWSYVMVVPRSGFASATLRGMYSQLPF
jgi:microbial collagenase